MSVWKSCGKSETGSDYTLFKLDEQDASIRIQLGCDAWLLVREHGVIVEFAVFEFHDSDIDGSNVHYMMLLHGSGVAGLRECRHIWWGDPEDAGYTHSLDFGLVEAALRELRRWFDG